MKVFTINIKQKYMFSIYFNNQRIKSLLFFGIILMSLCFFSQSVISQEVKLPKELRKEYRKANRQNKRGKYKIAMDNYLYVIEQRPFHINSLIKYADICFKREHNYKEAFEKYDRVLPLIKDEITRLENLEKQKRKIRNRIKYLKEEKIHIDNRIISCRSYLNEEQRKKNKERENKLFGEKRKNVKGINNKQQINNRTDNVVNNDHKIIDYNLNEFNSKEFAEKWKATKNDFLTGFIKLNAKNDEQKLEIIKKEVQKQFRVLKRNLELSDLTYYKINEINQLWLDGIKFQQYEWFDKLKDKESYYRDRVEEYNNLLIKRIKLENESDIKNDEIIGIRKKISILKKEKERLILKKEEGLKQELKSRLRTIPKSILLIGRIKHNEKADKKTLHKKLINKMLQVAIHQINGYKILNKQYSKQEDISKLFEITSEGIAQTSNEFYKQIRIYFPDGIRTYVICRIDVYPFDEKEIQNAQITKQKNNNTVSYDIDVYKTSLMKDSILINKLFPEFKEENIAEHRFNKDKLDFIKQENKFSNSLNAEYKAKIESTINWYKNEQEELLIKINKNEEELKKELKKIEIKQKDSIFNKLQIDSIIKESKRNYNEEIKKSKDEYEIFYRNKLQYINHIATKNTQTIPTDITIETAYKNLAKKCFNYVKDNYAREYHNTTIYKESKKNNTLIDFREDVVKYEAIIDSFRIITLGNYNNDKDSQNTNLFLNMAFVIKWKPEDEKNASSEKPEVFEEPLSLSDKQEISNKPNVNDKIDVNDEPEVPEEPLVTNRKDSEWKCFGTELSTYRSYLYEKENGWKIPNKDELRNIISSSKNQRKINNSFFGSDNWPNSVKEIILITNNSEINKTNNRKKYIAYKISKNWVNVSTIKVDDGEEVYILLIKD